MALPVEYTNGDAERSVISAIIASKDAYDAVIGTLNIDDYSDRRNATIHEAVAYLYDTSAPVDHVSVATRLSETGKLGKIGGGAYLTTCMDSVVVGTVGWYVQRVVDCATRRRARQVADRAASMLDNPEIPIDAALDRTRAEIESIAAGRPTSDMIRWGDVATSGYTAIEEAGDSKRGSGILTGLVDLDSLIGGLCPGQLVVVAARPGVGKSVLTCGNFVRAAMIQKVPTALWSLEMSTEELFARAVSAACKIDHGKVRDGQLDDGDWVKIARYIADTSDDPLWVNASADHTMASIRTTATRMRNANNIGLIVIDYLQLIGTARAENRQVAVSSLSRQLKLLARDLEIPIVVAAQLNRNPEVRPNKVPQLSDLRESGSLEQDADVVILLHREDMADADSCRAGEADLIVAKNRHRKTGTVTTAAQLHFQRFASIA